MSKKTARLTDFSVVTGVITVTMVGAVTFTTPHVASAQATGDRSSPEATPRSSQVATDPLRPGSVGIRRGWLWYSPSTVVALLTRLQAILERTNSGDDRPADWVLLSLSYDPQQLSRQDVAEGIAVQFPDADSRPLVQAVPSWNPDGRAVADDVVLKTESESTAMRLIEQHAGRTVSPDR